MSAKKRSKIEKQDKKILFRLKFSNKSVFFVAYNNILLMFSVC